MLVEGQELWDAYVGLYLLGFVVQEEVSVHLRDQRPGLVVTLHSPWRQRWQSNSRRSVAACLIEARPAALTPCHPGDAERSPGWQGRTHIASWFGSKIVITHGRDGLWELACSLGTTYDVDIVDHLSTNFNRQWLHTSGGRVPLQWS